MKNRLIGPLICLLLTVGTAQAIEKSALKNHNSRISYSIGVDIGKNMRKAAVEVDPAALAQGIKDGLQGKPLLSEKEMKDTLDAYKKELPALKAQKNKKEGEAFLAANKKKPGIKVLPDGLQYKVIKQGTGKIPHAGDTVVVNYRGTHLDGTEFDSSQRYSTPAVFKVTALIAGWREAVQMMPAGSRWLLYVPSELAYGEKGASRDIGPNETLIFDLELLSIK